MKYVFWFSIVFITMASFVFQKKLGTLYINQKYPYLKSTYETAKINEELKEKLPLLRSFNDQLSAYSFFLLGSNGSKDANHILNSMIGFDGKNGSLKLPDKLITKLKKKTPTHELSVEWDQFQLDFSWISNLNKYDHWNYDKFSDFDKNAYYGFNHYPSPNFNTLVYWGQLRLLHGKNKGDVHNALTETRHLARLIFTTDNPEGVQAALKLLLHETQFWNSLNENTKAEHRWPAIPTNVILAAKDYYLLQKELTDPRLSDQLFSVFSHFQTGRCYRTNQSLLTHLILRDFLRDQYQDSMKRVSTTVAASQSSCRESLARRAWNKKKYWIMGNNMTLKNLKGLDKLDNWFTETLTLSDLTENPPLGKALSYDILIKANRTN